jgi:hypothetical protein
MSTVRELFFFFFEYSTISRLEISRRPLIRVRRVVYSFSLGGK